MSFWYLADPSWFADINVELDFTGVINDTPIVIADRWFNTGTVKIEKLDIEDQSWERSDAAGMQLKIVRVTLLIDRKNTWNKKFENVSNLFMAYPYQWEDSDSGKPDTKMKMKSEEISTGEDQENSTTIETLQPDYDKTAENISAQRIFCTMYDPNPKNEGEESEPIWVQDPQKAIQFFGTREECFRLNPNSEPTEVTEPMYLDENGFVLYPDKKTGKVDPKLSPKVDGYTFKPVDFSPLHIPQQ